MASEKKKAGFEESMLRLEEIVRLLEKGDAPLEDSIKLFEEGTKLAKRCDDLLNEAEKKVVVLSKVADGAPVETEFDVGE
ncbi:MAG: exodeoxyribonuclease VII small subunit [Oscillospiraceae bacterium]|nr:exodeoxyribonuclease VII small subunit [Oscillospiraceae bacterium]